MIHRIEAIAAPCDHHFVPVQADDGTWMIQCDGCKLYVAKSNAKEQDA